MTPDALGRDRRAQTVQDFAVGASVFLLTVAFTFAFVPSIFTPFESEVVAGAGPQADRVATSFVEEFSMDERSNWLKDEETEDFFDTSSSPGPANPDELQDKYDLPLASNVNIVVRPIDGGSPVDSDEGVTLEIGDGFNDRPAASVTRVVVVEDVPECDPTVDADTGKPGIQGKGCQMIVRVW